MKLRTVSRASVLVVCMTGCSASPEGEEPDAASGDTSRRVDAATDASPDSGPGATDVGPADSTRHPDVPPSDGAALDAEHVRSDLSPVDGTLVPDRMAPDAGPPPPGPTEPTGQYLLAISTYLQPERPFLFGAHVDFTSAADPTPERVGEIFITLQPLRCNGRAEPVDCPRTPVGPPLPEVVAVVAADGSFRAPLGEFRIPGEANPVSGTNLVLSATLHGSALGLELCGDVEGELLQPFEAALARDMNHFGTTRVGELDAEAVDFAGVEVRTDCAEGER